MRLYCLSGTPSKPCFVLTFKDTTIMFDCGLDLTPFMSFVPLPVVHGGKFSKLPGWSGKDVAMGVKLDDELREAGGKVFVDGPPEVSVPQISLLDMSEVDVILLSNYHNMLALPYITEYSQFQGRVFATEPTLQIGKLYMEEMVEYFERLPKFGRATKWKQPNVQGFLPQPLCDAISPPIWRQMYNNHDIQASCSKIQTVGFSEKLDIFGSVVVTAISSGFCIGSANWIVQSAFEKISYVSGTSTLTTHPRPMEQAPLRNSDVIIMCALTQTPTANPDSMIGEFCINTALTLRNGGNVLVPCYPSGVTYDLFECLSGHLDSCGLSQVPMYFISPQANASLQYSNIYAEWLSTGKSSKVYIAEPPFPHAELIKCNRLKHYPSLHEGFTNEMKTPCVVFTGHPSLRLGDTVHFMELWGRSSSNTIVFTEPDFPYLDALAPYQPLAMKVCYCPIDTSLSFAQANKLIKDLKPTHLVTSQQYTVPPAMLPHRTDLVIDKEASPIAYKKNEILKLPIKRKYEKVDLDPEVAATLMPTEIRPGVAVTTVTGVLNTRDNNYVIKAIPPDLKHSKVRRGSDGEVKKPTYLYGILDVHEFVDQLKKYDLTDVKVEDCQGGGHIIDIPSEDTLIQLEEGSTHIIMTSSNEETRCKIRDSLLKSLHKF